MRPVVKRPLSTRRNPVTNAGNHLRPGQRVLWQSDDDHFLLAYVDAADSSSKHMQKRIPIPHALLDFPNGVQVITPFNRFHTLPRHGPYRRERQRKFRGRRTDRAVDCTSVYPTPFLPEIPMSASAVSPPGTPNAVHLAPCHKIPIDNDL